MKLTLHIWRQAGPTVTGKFETYTLDNVNEHMSFLEMLDVLNEQLIAEGKEPVAFEHDCREGICGSCGMVINGRPHGGRYRTTACQLHMRMFCDGDELWIEPWRAKAFPVLKDLIVDRSAFDRIIAAGGYISSHTGGVPDANAIPVPKPAADRAFDAAACIGCGACVAACPNASAMLFVAAKIAHLGSLPQGQPERYRRVRRMVEQMESDGFGHCSNHYECEAACPKGISVGYIAQLNRDLRRAELIGEDVLP
ncbi:MAG: succinate dehydrogenase/fumarate reductase iron-sulfur subunit [Chlorobi bacterium]|nr:succinate dehydrogenase/fumarate reductase iron-sulfur subunit [Chlorobiota bacterium]